MKRRFDQIFRFRHKVFFFLQSFLINLLRYDEKKLPRSWTADVDINALYVDARVQALKILEIFSDPSDELTIQGLPIFSLPSEQVEVASYFGCYWGPESCSRFSYRLLHNEANFVAMQAENLRDQLDQSILAVYQEALAVQSTMVKYDLNVLLVILFQLSFAQRFRTSGLPTWIYFLLAILGFNEVCFTPASDWNAAHDGRLYFAGNCTAASHDLLALCHDACVLRGRDSVCGLQCRAAGSP